MEKEEAQRLPSTRGQNTEMTMRGVKLFRISLEMELSGRHIHETGANVYCKMLFFKRVHC